MRQWVDAELRRPVERRGNLWVGGAPLLDRVSHPCLVIWGDSDRVIAECPQDEADLRVLYGAPARSRATSPEPTSTSTGTVDMTGTSDAPDTGSTMKAATNVAAIRDGYSLEDTFEGNSPIDIAGTEFEVDLRPSARRPALQGAATARISTSPAIRRSPFRPDR